MTARAVGIDGHAKGWVAVELGRGRFVRAWAAPRLAELLAPVPAAATVGIDTPVGGLDHQWRTADAAAKAFLGGRHPTVFSVPPRRAWRAASHDDANRICRELTGVGLSVQAWGLMARILEADEYRGTGRHELHEVHPELVFAGLAGERLANGKKTWNGSARRRALLAAVGVELPAELGEAGLAGVDDVLDAAAVAWCAYRIGRGQGRRLPEPPDQYDDAGRPIVIWF